MACSSHPDNSHRDRVRVATPTRGIVLVVDDEPVVCALTAEMLRELGYEVYEATSARRALKSLREGLKIDLLVTDIRMPEMSGIDLAEKVLSDNSAVKVLYISAYAAETHGLRGQRLAGELLQKPFAYWQLEEAMQRLTPVRH